MTASDNPFQGPARGRLVFGLGLIIFGLLFLGYRLHLIPDRFFAILPLDEPWRFWPMILVVVGLSKIATHGFLHGKGHFMLGLGVLFQFGMLEHEEVVWTWWPVLLVWWGILVMLRALNRPSKPEAPASVEPDSHE
jgi:hypothetical protein